MSNQECLYFPYLDPVLFEKRLSKYRKYRKNSKSFVYSVVEPIFPPLSLPFSSFKKKQFEYPILHLTDEMQ